MARIQPPEKAREFPHLNECAAKLRNYEKTRKATTQILEDIYGVRNDKGKIVITDPVALGMIAAIHEREVFLTREMILAYRAEVPRAIQEWVKATPGMDEKSMARVLGAMGHPVHAFEYREGDLVREFHRRFPQLRAYAALGKPGHIPKGATQEDVFSFGKPEIKMRMYLISMSAKILNGQVVRAKQDKDGNDIITVRTGTFNQLSPYHHVYEAAKKEAVARGWDLEKSKALGSNRADQHAIRMVSKAILADLYDVAKGTCC